MSGRDMPDVGTPQATWRRDEQFREEFRRHSMSCLRPLLPVAEAAVAARDREVAATLRAKIMNLPCHAHADEAWVKGTVIELADVLAVLDAVLGGDS